MKDHPIGNPCGCEAQTGKRIDTHILQITQMKNPGKFNLCVSVSSADNFRNHRQGRRDFEAECFARCVSYAAAII